MYTPIFPPQIGGPATQCFNLCVALQRNGVTPVVVTYGAAFSTTSDHGFTVHAFRSVYTHTPIDKAIRWIVFPFYIWHIFRAERIDVLHCHCISALSFIAGAVAKLMGIPRAIKFAGDWVWETLSTHKLVAKDFEEVYRNSWRARFMLWVERKGLGLFQAIWATSEFRIRNIESVLGREDAQKKIVHIPNCLLLSGGGSRQASAQDPVTVISANRFIPHKRIPFIVETFAKAGIPGSKLVLIGTGAQKEIDAVTAAVKAFGLEGRVELTGSIPSEEVYSRFSAASFYISASLEEGFPNVFIEAMHYGLPIITADAGGCREMVLDSKTGYVIEPYDAAAFVEKTKLLATDTALRNRMSAAAFERSKLFDLENRVSDFIHLYQRLLSSGK